MEKYCLSKVMCLYHAISSPQKALIIQCLSLSDYRNTVLMGICELRTKRINMPSAIFSDNLLHVSNVSFPECKAFINCTYDANISHHFYFLVL